MNAYAAIDAAYQRQLDETDERMAFEDRVCIHLYAMNLNDLEKAIPDQFSDRINAIMSEVIDAAMNQALQPRNAFRREKQDPKLAAILRAA